MEKASYSKTMWRACLSPSVVRGAAAKGGSKMAYGRMIPYQGRAKSSIVLQMIRTSLLTVEDEYTRKKKKKMKSGDSCDVDVKLDSVNS